MYYFNAVSKTTVSVSLAVLLFAAGAHAQVEVDEQGAAASAAENVEATRRLGAITVTAQKREQSLQFEANIAELVASMKALTKDMDVARATGRADRYLLSLFGGVRSNVGVAL